MESKIKASLTAQELRIGNWVNYKDNPYQIMYTVSNVVGVDLDSETLDTHHSNVSVLDLQPIELTEQVLLKCGFEKDAFGRVYFYDDVLGLGFIHFSSEATCYLDFEGTICGKKIRWLHELQNLIFALTGKELEFKA